MNSLTKYILVGLAGLLFLSLSVFLVSEYLVEDNSENLPVNENISTNTIENDSNQQDSNYSFKQKQIESIQLKSDLNIKFPKIDNNPINSKEIHLSEIYPGVNVIDGVTINSLTFFRREVQPIPESRLEDNFYEGDVMEVEYYKHNSREYKKERILETFGSGGQFYEDRYYILNNNEWEFITEIGASNSTDYLLSYLDYLIIISDGHWSSGCCTQSYGAEIVLFDISTSSTSRLSSGYFLDTPTTCPIFKRLFEFQIRSYNGCYSIDPIKLVVSEDKLFIKANLDYCYWLSYDFPKESGQSGLLRYGVDDFDVSEYESRLLGGCADSFHLVKDGQFIELSNLFKEYYIEEALRHHNSLYSAYDPDWLSPLISRTLQFIFAGEEEVAWQTFKEDFDKINKAYDTRELNDADQNIIMQDIKQTLSTR